MTINEARTKAMQEAHKANRENKFSTWSECVKHGWKVARLFYSPASGYDVVIIKETAKAVCFDAEVIEEDGTVVQKGVWCPKSQLATSSKPNMYFWFDAVLANEAETTIVRLASGLELTYDNCEGE